MVSLFALYRQPQDEARFMTHYQDVHAPLARQLPGLISLEWGKEVSLGASQGESWFMVAEMRFSDRGAMDQALQSPQGKAAAADLRTFAKGLLTMKAVEWQ